LIIILFTKMSLSHLIIY